MAAPLSIECETLGAAWLAVARRILDGGVRASCDGLGELGVRPAALVVHAKSAHVYETEWAAVEHAVCAEPLPAG